MRLLIADDNPALREGLAELLGADGFDCHLAADGVAARAAFEAGSFPIVILDIVMPGLDGLRLCRQIRAAAPLTQILILSARGDSLDKTLGLEFGADDYVAKPFDPAELRARVATMRRRAQSGIDPAPRFRMDDLWIDPARFIATRPGVEIALNRRELAVLQLLHRHAGMPVDRDTLFDACWGRDWFPSSRALDQYISALRQKIERDPRAPRIIETVRGIGYRFPAGR